MKKLLNSISKDTGYELQSPKKIYQADKESNIRIWFWMICLSLFVLMWMPWTQNIQTTGTITTLYQDQRPQQLNSIIPGRILKWWVKEGDFVKVMVNSINFKNNDSTINDYNVILVITTLIDMATEDEINSTYLHNNFIE